METLLGSKSIIWKGLSGSKNIDLFLGLSLVGNRKFGNLGGYFHESLNGYLTESLQHLAQVIFFYFVFKWKILGFVEVSKDTEYLLPCWLPFISSWLTVITLPHS